MDVLRRQEKKGERIRQKRGEQKEFMKIVVQRVLAEFIEAGRLGKNELDDAAKGVLEKMEAKVRYDVIDVTLETFVFVYDIPTVEVFTPERSNDNGKKGYTSRYTYWG